MKKALKTKLAFIQKVQKVYPQSHVGGSFGLFLRGISIGRDISDSDIDIKIPNFKPEQVS